MKLKKKALSLYDKGKLPAAKKLFKKICKEDFNDLESWQVLAIINAQLGNLDETIKCFAHIVKVSPANPEAHFNLGFACQQAGRLEKARGSYKQALQLKPEYQAACINLASTYRLTNNAADAISCYQQALGMIPGDFDALSGLATVYQDSGDHDNAIKYFSAALERNSNSAEAYTNLGLAYSVSDNSSKALQQYKSALDIDPGYYLANYNIAVLYELIYDKDKALEYFKKATDIASDNIDPYTDIARLHIDSNDINSARKILEQALNIEPKNITVITSLAKVMINTADRTQAKIYLEMAQKLAANHPETLHITGLYHALTGEYQKAIESYNEVLGIDPKHINARTELSHRLLSRGEYQVGWESYELISSANRAVRIAPKIPPWDGKTPAPILIYGEQGLGDEIMFASCFQEVIKAVPRCHIECDQRLSPIFEQSFPKANIIHSLTKDSLAEYIESNNIEYAIRAGSLPHLYRNRLEDFPQHTGYLQADQAKVKHWATKLSALGEGLRIGISWRGGVVKTRRLSRSIPLEDLMPLFGHNKMHFISLQYGDVKSEIDKLAKTHAITIHHWQQAIDDYAETAALVSSLDLVISVQTAIIHLTGALGKRAFVMVPKFAEWRYGQSGPDMPWYPSITLFRQQTPGDWGNVIKKVHDELTSIIK